MYKNKIVLAIYLLLSSLAYGQEVMVTTLKNGQVRTEKVDNIAEISFVGINDNVENVLRDVTRGLVSYYNFDNRTANDLYMHANGFLNGGTFINDSPCEGGRALKLSKKEYMNLASATLDGKENYTVSLWIKDWGAGPILSSQANGRVYGPTLYMTETGKLLYYATDCWNSDCRITFSVDLSSFQNGQWTMLTIVTTDEKTSSLYVNGRKAASGTVLSRYNSGAVAMMIGGTTNYTSSPVSSAWADPMKIDNVRIYSVALSDEEVQAIYDRESHSPYYSVSPDEIEFDKNTSVHSFNITNQIGGHLSFSVSDEMGVLNITPQIGQLKPFESIEVNASLADRDDIESFIVDNICLSIADSKYYIPVKIEKGVNAVNKNVVTRGLQVLYNFDGHTADDNHQGYYPATLTGGSFVNDTPNRTGYSLQLLKKEYMTIPTALLDGKQNYSVNLWIKDWGTGPLISSQGDKRLYGPSLYMAEMGTLLYYATDCWNSDSRTGFTANLSNYQSGQWMMLTIVTTDYISTLYINGHRASSESVRSYYNSGASSMCIGGTTNYTSNPVSSAWADPMKIDNIRLYSVALTDEEVMEIYNAERK